MQHSSEILMIEPVQFAYNEETAVNNAFQVKATDQLTQEKALVEFTNMVNSLRSVGIQVTVIKDTVSPCTPDSIFPNNWISFHEDASIVLYPMFALNRRKERKASVLDIIANQFVIHKQIDLSHFEQENLFLEGTGSMVLDRTNKLAYCCLSIRTDESIIKRFCTEYNYEAVIFKALDMNDQLIYHTNVMMCVADNYVVICLDSIKNLEEQKMVMNKIQSTNKEIINISLDQMNHFAGNMLQVHNQEGKPYLVMSTQAFQSLDDTQIQSLSKYNEILHQNLETIETNGGGSARCMMAEVFLPKR